MATPKLQTTVANMDDFKQIEEYVRYLAGLFADLSGELNWILTGNLDVNNIKSKSIVTDLLAAGAVKAEKIDVDQLSAITSNIGHITAGLIEAVTIIGSLIRTAGTYPRCEMSSTGNLFAAYYDANNFVAITPDLSGKPAVQTVNGGGLLGKLGAGSLGDYLLQSVGTLTLYSPLGMIDSDPMTYHRFPNWSKVYNRDTLRTLKQDLDDLSTGIASLSGSVSSINGSISALWSAIGGLDSRVSALESP